MKNQVDPSDSSIIYSVPGKSMVDINSRLNDGSIMKNGDLQEIIFQSHTTEKKDIFYDEMAYVRDEHGSMDSSSNSYLKLEQI